MHVNLKVIKANKCLHVLQYEIDHLFTVSVFPNFIYGLPVYGASEPDLNIIQNILDRCHKCRFISYPVSIKDLLKNQDCKIFKKVTSINNHPIASYTPYPGFFSLKHRSIATLSLTTVSEFRANFPAFYRCLQHPRLASCFVVIQKGNLLRP